MEGGSSSATANTELQDLAALLWASNEKGDIHLHPAEAGALARFLGLERIRQEVSQDAELAADMQMKGFAAAALMLVAEKELADKALAEQTARRNPKGKAKKNAKRNAKADADRDTKPLSTDIPTIQGLHQTTLETIACTMADIPLLDPTEELPDLTDPEVAKRYAISASDIIMRLVCQQQQM
ncbi:hypothetical protein VTO73DRAFT_10127 [Trametes versicolor]